MVPYRPALSLPRLRRKLSAALGSSPLGSTLVFSTCFHSSCPICLADFLFTIFTYQSCGSRLALKHFGFPLVSPRGQLESAVLLFQFGRIIGSTRRLIWFRPDAESLPRGSAARAARRRF